MTKDTPPSCVPRPPRIADGPTARGKAPSTKKKPKGKKASTLNLGSVLRSPSHGHRTRVSVVWVKGTGMRGSDHGQLLRLVCGVAHERHGAELCNRADEEDAEDAEEEVVEVLRVEELARADEGDEERSHRLTDLAKVRLVRVAGEERAREEEDRADGEAEVVDGAGGVVRDEQRGGGEGCGDGEEDGDDAEAGEERAQVGGKRACEVFVGGGGSREQEVTRHDCGCHRQQQRGEELMGKNERERTGRTDGDERDAVNAEQPALLRGERRGEREEQARDEQEILHRVDPARQEERREGEHGRADDQGICHDRWAMGRVLQKGHCGFNGERASFVGDVPRTAGELIDRVCGNPVASWPDSEPASRLPTGSMDASGAKVDGDHSWAVHRPSATVAKAVG
ncbi:hypothetical protein GGX14DRAFT_399855 [Mycena pura]|uniref:Uncharacterized protein n=1 Tax=Mycena pura TaxID=153505 RepID=A0AAD6Y560_9AGAR|nr:hypothetical protein GGX14DRAFT_399855 [Mycena pura]